MSALGARTKKVTTYGKKQSRIINIHADITPERPTTTAAGPADSPLPVKRQPLKAKPSQDTIARRILYSAPDTPLKALKTFDSPLKPKAAAVQSTRAVLGPSRVVKAITRKPPSSDDDEVVFLKNVTARRTRRVVIPRSPSSSPGRTSVPGSMVRGRLRHAIPPTTLRSHVAANDLTARLAKVSLEDEEEKKKAKEQPSTASPLDDLLAVCTISERIPFDKFFVHTEFTPLLRGTDTTIRKYGEASYSEVFTVGAEDTAVVVKVIPLLGDNAEFDVELPDCSEIPDVVREIEMTRRMAGVPGGGFVDFLGAFVVEGAYPQVLLDQWDQFKEENGSESTRPVTFPSTQLYALIILPNGGVDLESFKFEQSRGWVQAAAVFWQVADALARAEQWTQFEHRDLHEGQILVTSVDAQPPAPVKNYLDPEATAVRTAVIDFGLSRLDLPGKGAVFTHLPKEVYEGVGDQWDVYRAMRDTLTNDASTSTSSDPWTGFHPATNVMWLHYLAKRLLRSTPSLRKPYARRGSTATAAAPRNSAAAKKEVIRARAEAAWGMLCIVENTLAMGLAPNSSSRGSRAKSKVELGSAAAVMEWGREQEWVA